MTHSSQISLCSTLFTSICTFFFKVAYCPHKFYNNQCSFLPNCTRSHHNLPSKVFPSHQQTNTSFTQLDIRISMRSHHVSTSFLQWLQCARIWLNLGKVHYLRFLLFHWHFCNTLFFIYLGFCFLIVVNNFILLHYPSKSKKLSFNFVLQNFKFNPNL